MRRGISTKPWHTTNPRFVSPTASRFWSRSCASRGRSDWTGFNRGWVTRAARWGRVVAGNRSELAGRCPGRALRCQPPTRARTHVRERFTRARPNCWAGRRAEWVVRRLKTMSGDTMIRFENVVMKEIVQACARSLARPLRSGAVWRRSPGSFERSRTNNDGRSRGAARVGMPAAWIPHLRQQAESRTSCGRDFLTAIAP